VFSGWQVCAFVCVCVCVSARECGIKSQQTGWIAAKNYPPQYKTYTSFLIKYDIYIYTESMVRKITRLRELSGVTKLNHLDADYGFLSRGLFKSIITHSMRT